MKIRVVQVELPLKHSFTIARESIQTQTSMLVELEQDGVCGYGEVTENRFYGRTFESIRQSLQTIIPQLDLYRTQSPTQAWQPMQVALAQDPFALSALDMAAHDLRGKRLGVATWKDWGLQWNAVPESSFTIGIDSVETMVAKLHEESGWNIYKIKLGTGNDLEIVTELRRHTDAVLRVDANCGWSVEQTIKISKRLADLGVEFIEQPLPITASEADKKAVFQHSALPLIADEDCQTAADVVACSGMYHGINIKLCKCGGLTVARQMLRQARSLGLKTMIGCMVETSIGISGAAQLLPLLDFADLDGANLLRDQPATGVTVDKGKVVLSNGFGCGGQIDHLRLNEFTVRDHVIEELSQ
ncbi:dipeptide epimerase [Stieleria sp. TO1_6]|uniref:dipeptide epimerase n=1 Tax=Stieleria tagensis TaxID=2956795 RepID=UPI00209AA850|nr:dipeptide epimerase [Stieleria tagensis]MCO8120622.1 dipeptide epimerase [Stieleria tagensis]